MLKQYLAEFDLHPFDENFFVSSKAELIEITGYPNNKSDTLKFNSLKEVQSFLRIRLKK
jgi:hypothetical protein